MMWKPTHCLKGEAPLPVMLIEEAGGFCTFHDGFAKNVRMSAEIFHRIYIPIGDYGKRPKRAPRKKKAEVLPLPTAQELAERARKVAKKPKPKPGWKPKNSTDFFV